MPVQTTYSEQMRAGLPGLVVGSFGPDDSVTGNVETAAGIGFGLAVSQGVADKGIIIGGTRAGFLGITIRDVTLESDQEDKYAQYQSAGVLTKGQIWVTAGAAVEAGGPVHFVAATGVLTDNGNEGPINGARWVTSAAQDELAIVELSGYKRSA